MKRVWKWLAAIALALLVMGAGLAEEAYLPLEAAEGMDSAAVEWLDLGARYRTVDQVIAILDRYPNLRAVNMFATPVGYRSVEKLEARYPGITFGWTLWVGDHKVRTDATAFSTLHYSTSETHGMRDLNLLRYCHQLRALDIGHNGCDDLSFVEELPELRVLIVAVNRLTDITPLASLSNLEYLEIFSNHITDISPLKGLTHLMDLNIAYNDIADFSPLYEMPWLKRLWMYNSVQRDRRTPVPQEVLDTLAEKLPDTLVNAVNNPSEGGWREHPHFDVIHAMFRPPLEQYVPFEDSY